VKLKSNARCQDQQRDNVSTQHLYHTILVKYCENKFQKGWGWMNWWSTNINENIPITNESPLLNVQGIHTNIKEDKNLGNKWQGCESMPVIIRVRFRELKNEHFLMHHKTTLDKTYLVVTLELSVTLCQV
jgi:hypothetical protein